MGGEAADLGKERFLQRLEFTLVHILFISHALDALARDLARDEGVAVQTGDVWPLLVALALQPDSDEEVREVGEHGRATAALVLLRERGAVTRLRAVAGRGDGDDVSHVDARGHEGGLLGVAPRALNIVLERGLKAYRLDA